MEAKKSVSYLLLVIGILVMGLAGCIGYIAGNSGNDTNENSSNVSYNDDVMKEIEELKALYDSKISEKTASFKDLKTEKEKVKQLVFELEKTKADANSLLKYKDQYKNLESKMHVLVDEIVALKTKKTSVITTTTKKIKPLVDTNNQTITVKKTVAQKKEVIAKPLRVIVDKKPLKESKIAAFENKTEIVQKVETKVEKQPEIIYELVPVSNLKSAGYDIKSAIKIDETNIASKTDIVKVTFTLEANANAKAEEKKFYIQVIDYKNNVMGKKITEFFDDKSLTYSYSKTIQYNNQTLQVVQEIFANEYQKGTYFVNIFDRSKLVAHTSFTLK